MNKKIGMIIGAIILALIAGVALFKGMSKPEEVQEVAKSETMTIKHALGETVVPKNPQKVVVFELGILDAMQVLGIQDAVVAAPKSSLSGYLETLNRDDLVDVGSVKEPDFEKIYGTKPDLIIIGGRQASMIDKFTEIAPTISMAVDNNNYTESFKANMNILGELFGVEDKVVEQVSVLEKEMEVVKAKVEEKGYNTLITLINDGSVSAYGNNSRFSLINDLGFTNVDTTLEEVTHGQTVSFEYIVEKDPDFLFVLDRGAIMGDAVPAKEILENELIKTTKAYKEGNIVYLSPQPWYLSGGGLTSTKMMIEDIANAVK